MLVDIRILDKVVDHAYVCVLSPEGPESKCSPHTLWSCFDAGGPWATPCKTLL